MKRQVPVCKLIALLVFMVLTSPDTGVAATVDDMGVRAVPARISSGPSVGAHHTCAVKADGSVRCWGANGNGQLGDTTFIDRTAPVSVPGIKDAVEIAAGDTHTCARRVTGGVICWGANADGQLGDGSVTQRSKASLSVGGISAAVAITSGTAHSCAVLADGTVSCWGANTSGQLGDGTLEQRTTPILVSGLVGGVTIEAGARSTCARLANGTVTCWGRNIAGQLGDGTTTDRLTPVATVGLTDAVAVAHGNRHTCALQANDAARCWGENLLGQLGNGTTSGSTVPQVVGGGGGTISGRGLASGNFSNHTCARRADGTLACWGHNSNGQVGSSSGQNQLLPVTVSGLSNVVAATAGGVFTCALDGDGAVWCWGGNFDGQLGDGTTTTRTQPVAVAGLPAAATAVSAAGSSVCALINDGTVSCWGRNTSGQLGDGSLTTRLTPVAVAGLEDVVAVAAGASHACALLGNGQVRCWGANGSGQLGDGTTTNRLVPTPVVGLPNAVAIAAGLAHTCVLLADGTGRCWGRNSQGQLGIGILGDMTVPVTPINLVAAATISAGGDHTCSGLVNGEVRCWGDNGVNQASHLVGDQLTPVTVVLSNLVPLRSVVAVAVGNFHTCALQSTGAVYCWGSNGVGQVGDGTNVDKQFPTEVTSFRFNIAQSAELKIRGRLVRVTALMNCQEGAHVHVEVTLTQGGVKGHGLGIGKCTGVLEEYDVIVLALGRHDFDLGAAVASAEAVVHQRGKRVETQEWTRNVQLVDQNN